MQRITRYALLLRQILHYTPKLHREYDSSMIALQMSEEFLDHINNAIKLRQSILNIDRIVKTVDLEIPSEVCHLLKYVLTYDVALSTGSQGSDT